VNGYPLGISTLRTGFVRKFQFRLVALDRTDLRKSDSKELQRLNAIGSEGWHVIHVKEDPQNNRDLLFFLEREEG
jgi:hypothetical protein